MTVRLSTVNYTKWICREAKRLFNNYNVLVYIEKTPQTSRRVIKTKDVLVKLQMIKTFPQVQLYKKQICYQFFHYPLKKISIKKQPPADVFQYSCS